LLDLFIEAANSGVWRRAHTELSDAIEAKQRTPAAPAPGSSGADTDEVGAARAAAETAGALC
jgi:hypothetical protein